MTIHKNLLKKKLKYMLYFLFLLVISLSEVSRLSSYWNKEGIWEVQHVAQIEQGQILFSARRDDVNKLNFMQGEEGMVKPESTTCKKE